MSLMNDVNEAQVMTNTDTAPFEQLKMGEAQEEKPSWWWDDNTPGSGERPSYLSDKYKSVSDQAKAQRELEQRLGIAPAQYDFTKGEKWFDPDYESFQELADYAKSKHVPQDVMDKVFESFGDYMEAMAPDYEEERTKLGENYKERLAVLNNWAKSNLSEKSYGALTRGMTTAESIEAIEEIRSKMLNANSLVPGNNDSAADSGMTMDDYRSEFDLAKYKADPAYRKKMQSKLEMIVGSKK